MRNQPLSFVALFALLLALLAGCSLTQPATPGTASPPTSAPNAPEPTSVPAEPTLPSKPSPTSAPTQAAPTAAPPTSTITSTALLPADTLWIQSANVVLPLAEGSAPLDVAARGYPAPIYRSLASPGGAYIAYGTEQGGLALIDVRSGESRALVEDGAGIAGFSFSPDGTELAATTITGSDWTLQVFELAQNGVHVLRSGSIILTDTDTLPLVPSPVVWTPNGLLVQYILYATDAPPHDPALLDPSSPTGETDQQVYEGPIISIYPSPDGTHFAIVTGELPLGGGTPTAQIRMVDQQGNQLATIRELQPGLLRALSWSPDRSMLVYALAPDYQTPNVTLHLVRADGSGAQELDLAAAGVGLFRDVAWRDAATLLLLTEGEQLQLSALPSDNFDAVALQSLRTFDGQQPGEGNGRILYVPR